MQVDINNITVTKENANYILYINEYGRYLFQNRFS